MRVFKDSEARSWSLVINVANAKRVRTILGIDFNNVISEGFDAISKIVSNSIDLVDVLYVLCKEEADKRSLTDEDFGRSFNGDVLEAAANAFVEELIDFFPNARAREDLRKVIDAGKTVRDKVMALAETKLATIDLDLEAEKLIVSYADAQEFSDSIQGRIRSETSS